TSQNFILILIINITWLTTEFNHIKTCIKFIELQRTYSGEAITHIVIETLNQYDIGHKLLTITTNNTLNNDTLYSELYQ
ncbi:hypothetical protein F5884DRAFT_648237, partial [Xylogone sp. PMI_703]